MCTHIWELIFASIPPGWFCIWSPSLGSLLMNDLCVLQKMLSWRQSGLLSHVQTSNICAWVVVSDSLSPAPTLCLGMATSKAL